MPVQVTYGPPAAVAVKPIEPQKRKRGNHDAAALRAMRAASKAKSDAMDADIEQIYDDAIAGCHRLGTKYDKDPQYFENRLFSGGMKKQKERKPNVWNAWQHRLMAQANEDLSPGERQGLINTIAEFRTDYNQLSDTAKQDLLDELMEDRDSHKSGFRLNQRSRIADVNAVWNTLIDLLKGLKARVGIEFVLVIVRNSHEFVMDPRWLISSEQIDEYLRTAIRTGWDPEKIGALLEAFAVAGCDFMAYYRTSREKISHLKKLIRLKIHDGLAKITGEPNIQMNYVNYEQEMIVRRGIILRGWTLPEFKNPSDLSTSLAPLKAQWEALASGECHWARATSEERAAAQESHNAKLASGQIKARKQRSDKGKKHARPKKSRKRVRRVSHATSSESSSGEGDEESSDDDSNRRTHKRRRGGAASAPKSAEFVENDSD